MPALIDAARVRASEGEIVATLQAVFGTYTEHPQFWAGAFSSPRRRGIRHMALKVMPNELDGWDVVREDEGVALTNHPDRASAEAAARLRAEEEHIGESAASRSSSPPTRFTGSTTPARGCARLPVPRRAPDR